jgi:hypothetical protein
MICSMENVYVNFTRLNFLEIYFFLNFDRVVWRPSELTLNVVTLNWPWIEVGTFISSSAKCPFSTRFPPKTTCCDDQHASKLSSSRQVQGMAKLWWTCTPTGGSAHSVPWGSWCYKCPRTNATSPHLVTLPCAILSPGSSSSISWLPRVILLAWRLCWLYPGRLCTRIWIIQWDKARRNSNGQFYIKNFTE